MTETLLNIKQSFKDAALFVFCYFIIFFFFISHFADGNQTGAQLILVDFYVSGVLIGYYILANIAIGFTGRRIVALAVKAIFLFVLAELAVLTITKQLPLFGFVQKYVYSKTPITGDASVAEQLNAFKESRDFAFSMSALLSAAFFVAINKLITKKKY